MHRQYAAAARESTPPDRDIDTPEVVKRVMAANDPTSGPSLQWEDRRGVTRHLRLIDRIFLGRVCRGIDRDKCILVADPVVSRDHAVVRLTRDGVEITDQSKNGTWVNDVRMAPGASRRLRDGDRITLGNTFIRFSCPPETPHAAEEDLWAEQTAIRPSTVFVTSLVADVRGFTALSQQIDSAVVYTFIKEIFSRFTAVVNDHHGTVKDYVGDAVFAFWEHPVAFSPQPALMACRAAVAQLRSLPDIHRRMVGQGMQLDLPRLGWGITSGQITLSHYGSRSGDLALVGDCVNLAFRLSSMAGKTLPAPIAICRQTAAMVSSQLTLVDLGVQPIRGRAGEEQLYGIEDA